MQDIRVSVGERDTFNPNTLVELVHGPGMGGLHHGGFLGE